MVCTGTIYSSRARERSQVDRGIPETVLPSGKAGEDMPRKLLDVVTRNTLCSGAANKYCWRLLPCGERKKFLGCRPAAFFQKGKKDWGDVRRRRWATPNSLLRGCFPGVQGAPWRVYFAKQSITSYTFDKEGAVTRVWIHSY